MAEEKKKEMKPLPIEQQIKYMRILGIKKAVK